MKFKLVDLKYYDYYQVITDQGQVGEIICYGPGTDWHYSPLDDCEALSLSQMKEIVTFMEGLQK